MTKNKLFSSDIYTFVLEDFKDINKDLLKSINTINIENSQSKSNAGGWHSNTNLYLNSNFNIFINEIINVVNNILLIDFYQNKLPISSEDIHALWAIINKKGDYNKSHFHPNSWLSGVYYVSVKDDIKNGSICFKAPVMQRYINEYTFSDNSYWECLQPTEGLLVLFPSYLEHRVKVNELDSDRVVLSFNIHPKPQEMQIHRSIN